MEFRILGPLEVSSEGQVLDLGGAKQRALLAVLLLHPNQVVSQDRLIDALAWAAEVRRALQALPDAQRQAIELAYFDGLSQTEIATKTDTPLGTVKMRVKLAIGKLATILKDDLSS